MFHESLTQFQLIFQQIGWKNYFFFNCNFFFELYNFFKCKKRTILFLFRRVAREKKVHSVRVYDLQTYDFGLKNFLTNVIHVSYVQ